MTKTPEFVNYFMSSAKINYLQKKIMHKSALLLTACIILSALNAMAQVSPADTAKHVIANFGAVEKEAYYPGGNAGWKTFLEKNLHADIPVKQNAPVGMYTATVQFIVDKDGTVSNVRAATNFGYGMEEEVIRVIEHSGKWMPAIQNDKPVKAYRKQPVTFVLDSEDFQLTTKEPYTLFANVDNEISVKARKIKASDISVTVQGGKATNLGEGKFNVRVSKAGRVLLTVVNNKKDDKEIGVAIFEVVAQ